MDEPKTVGSVSTDLLIQSAPIDPYELSQKWLIVILFFRSPSLHYKPAISLSSSASFFQQFIIEDKEVNFVGFDKTEKDLNKLITLQSLIRHWKGTRVFIKGRSLSNGRDFIQVLSTTECYLKSLLSNNSQAYCWEIKDTYLFESERKSRLIKVLDVLTEEKSPRPLLLVPCKRLGGWISKLSPHHPASLQDQFQALSIDECVDWCPNFHPEELKKVER